MNPVKYVTSLFESTTALEKLSRVFGNVTKTENNTYYSYYLGTEFTLSDSELQSITNGDLKNCLQVVEANLGEAFFEELKQNNSEEYWKNKIKELIPELQDDMPIHKAFKIIYEKLSNKSVVS